MSFPFLYFILVEEMGWGGEEGKGGGKGRGRGALKQCWLTKGFV